MTIKEKSFSHLRLGDCVGLETDGVVYARWVALLAKDRRGAPIAAFSSNLEDVSDRILNHDQPENLNIAVVMNDAVKGDITPKQAMQPAKAAPEAEWVYVTNPEWRLRNRFPDDDMLAADFSARALKMAIKHLHPDLGLRVLHEDGRMRDETIRGVAFGIDGPLSLMFDSLPDDWHNAQELGLFIPSPKREGSFLNIHRLKEVHKFNA